MVRQVPRLLMLPLLVCLAGALSAFVVGETVMMRLTDVIDPSRIHLSLPGEPIPSDTVWLCRPGVARNPCAGDLSSTSIAPDGASTSQPADAAKQPPIDCFYVYPTVSLQKTTNADLSIDQEERTVAQAEAARFSQVCNVYAPMYPQLTRWAVNDPEHLSITGAIDAYEGVWRGFLDYMDHYNHGRGIVFIGHSQGAFLLSMLLQAELDTEPKVLAHLVSAILPGGNITVEEGKAVGGDFRNIPACRSSDEVGCVIAYSTFSATPGEDSLFGRVDSPINPFRRDAPLKLKVLCVNPAAPAGGPGEALPYLPTTNLSSLLGRTWPMSPAKTPFVSYPNEYTAACRSDGHSNWLQIERTSDPNDTRPDISILSKPRWGLHTVDVNVVLGNLVNLVRSESQAYARKS